VTLRGVGTVAAVECSKLAAQFKPRAALAACAAGSFAFAAALRLQTTVPEDTLFGRSAKESGFALSLVVLGFAALWVVPALTSIVAGDLFAAEDRYGTWTMMLARSRARSEVFAGKALVAFGYSALAIAVLAASSIAAGLLIIGPAPLVNLSGVALTPSQALARTAFAWVATLPAALALTAIALLLSIVTRSSAAGIGVPVVGALTMQLCALVDGPQALRTALITTAFDGWHGLLAEPRYYGPLVRGVLASVAYLVVSVGIGYRTLQRRDIAG